MSIGVRRNASAASALCALAALFGADRVEAQCNYTVRLLEIPPHPQCPLTPAAFSGKAINNRGEVAGEYLICSGSTKACWWNATGQWFAIPIPGQSGGAANAISDASVITGGALVGSDNKWFVFSAGMTSIVNPPCGYLMANGREVCADGMRYGDVYCLDVVPENRVYGLTSDNRFVDLWADISTTGSSFVLSAHEGGLIAGRLVQGRGGVDTRAFRSCNGAVDVLGPVPGGYTSIAYGVNRWGDLAGSGLYDLPNWPRGDPVRGFVYIDSRMIDLGFLLPSDNSSEALDINDLCQVVGASSVWWYGPAHAMLWQHGEMQKLRDLVADPLLGSLKSARQINDRGDILTGASYDGVQRAIVLEPIRERVGDVDLDCKVGVHDLELVVRTWGSAYDYDHGPGDANNDHLVDATDLAYVLGDWDPSR